MYNMVEVENIEAVLNNLRDQISDLHDEKTLLENRLQNLNHIAQQYKTQHYETLLKTTSIDHFLYDPRVRQTMLTYCWSTTHYVLNDRVRNFLGEELKITLIRDTVYDIEIISRSLSEESQKIITVLAKNCELLRFLRVKNKNGAGEYRIRLREHGQWECDDGYQDTIFDTLSELMGFVNSH